jgi:hypothetical protein
MKRMIHITHQMAALLINDIASPFDAHMVERRALRTYPIAFARELMEFGHTNDPLHQFSAAFARWIDTEFTGRIRKAQKVISENLGGQQSQNQEWERITEGVEVT